VSFAVVLILLIIFQSPNDIPYRTQEYDELTNDLITREFGIDFVIYDEKPQNLCFVLEDQEGKFYRELETALQTADISYWSAPEKNEREWAHMDVYIYPTKKQGLELIKQHDFEHSKKKSETYNIKNLEDYYHEFLCNFEYDKKYYQIQLYFSNLYPGWDNFTFVNFTRTDGKPVIQNQDITIFHGGFNSTVIFYNQLEEPITLSFDQKERDGKSEIFDENDVGAIPTNKQWAHSFSYDNDDPKEFKYIVKPYDISGTIIFKSHPKCMDTDYAASLYSQAGLEIKLPEYLPEGYVHRCSADPSYNSLVSIYTKNELDSYPSYWNDDALYRQGGLAIMNAQRMYDVEWEMREDNKKTACDYIDNGTSLEIDFGGYSATAIFIKNDYDMTGVNSITLCDGNDSFSIRGKLSQDELVKIAESIQ